MTELVTRCQALALVATLTISPWLEAEESSVAQNPTLSFSHQVYVTCVGEAVAGTVLCTDCVLPASDGILQLMSFDLGVATISPASFGPIVTDPFNARFLIVAQSEGGVSIQAALFEQANLVAFVRTAVSVLPAGACSSPTCPSLQALAGQADLTELVDLLRRFRDQVMTLTSARRHYVDLYYQHAVETAWHLAADAELRSRTVSLIRELSPVFHDLLERRSGALSVDHLQTIERLMDEFEDRGSPTLREAVSGLREDLRSGHLLDLFELR